MIKALINERYVKMLRYIKQKNPNMRQIAKQTRFADTLVRERLIEMQEEKLIEPVFNNPEHVGRDYNIISWLNIIHYQYKLPWVCYVRVYLFCI